MITECPLRSRPHRTREMLSEGWGAMSLPQGLRTKGTELAAPGAGYTHLSLAAKGALEREDWRNRAAGGFLAEVAPSTFLRDVLRQLGRKCHVLGSQEAPLEGRG